MCSLSCSKLLLLSVFAHQNKQVCAQNVYRSRIREERRKVKGRRVPIIKKWEKGQIKGLSWLVLAVKKTTSSLHTEYRRIINNFMESLDEHAVRRWFFVPFLPSLFRPSLISLLSSYFSSSINSPPSKNSSTLSESLALLKCTVPCCSVLYYGEV